MQYILSDNTITVVIGGIPRSLHRGASDEKTWARALEAVENDDESTIESILDKPRGINRHFESKGIEVTGGVLYFNGEPLEDYGARKAVEFVEKDLPATALIEFLKRVRENPSYRAVQDLYRFLETNGMPLTPDGCFLAYKKVRDIDGHFYDIHTQSICNDIDTTIEMPRNQVDENPNQVCSFGLHVCSYDYLPRFGNDMHDTVIMVKVDPANVVAIPREYSNAKMRVCAYAVVREIPEWRTHRWDSGVVDAEAERPGHEVKFPPEEQGDVDDGGVLGPVMAKDQLVEELVSFYDELSPAQRERFRSYFRDVCRTLDMIPPISSHSIMHVLLNNGYDRERIQRVMEYGE